MRPRRLFTPLLSGTLCSMLLLAAATGCTPDEEKITRMIQEHLDRCKKAEGEIAQIVLFDGSTEPMLVSACEKPITEIVVDAGVTATAKTGPYTWSISQNDESGVWIASGLDWTDLHGALKILDQNETDEAVLADATKKLAAAQEAYPESAFVREKRLEALLRLRKVLRNKTGQDDPNGLGKDVQTYYDELLTWSKANDQPDLAGSASLKVITYLRGLEGFVNDSLDSLGSRDDVLETSISVAEKEKDQESADAYRKELEESRAKRPEQTAALQARKDAIRTRLCKEVGDLDAQSIKDGELKERAVSIKGAIDCTPAPATP